jgi:Mg/Co/Ni transporter MgtE
MNKLKEYLNSHELSEIHPSDIAKILKQLDDSEFTDAIKLVPKNLVGDVALALPDRYFDDVVESLSVDELSHAVAELESDDQLEFMQELEEVNDDSFEPKMAGDRDDIRDVVHTFKEYDLPVMPIINRYGVLLGRITSDDIYDIINEHATEQMYNLAGVDDDAEEDDEILNAGRKRATWLSLNLFTAIAASFVIALFSDTLESMVALAVLMPIVASMGGNAGTQSLTVVVRQLALGDISQGDAMRIIKRGSSLPW